MSRLAATFTLLKQQSQTGLVTFVTAGDPDYAASLALLKKLPEAGADIIELGMPFSDPMADGPAIQAANLRALKNGQNLSKTLQMVQEFRLVNTHIPIVLMGYANPIFQYGIEKFAEDAALAEVDGVIIVDIPPEQADDWHAPLQAKGIDFIRLATPTTDEKRLQQITRHGSGFLYYVAVVGITGKQQAKADDLAQRLAWLQTYTALPIAVGFGIKTPADAAALKGKAAAIVVGSALVEQSHDPIAVLQLVSALKAALK